MSAVAVLSQEQLLVLLEDAAERGAQKALARARPSGGELTTEQVAAELGLAPKTVRKHVKAGRLKASGRRRGAQLRFTRADLDSYRKGPASLAEGIVADLTAKG